MFEELHILSVERQLYAELYSCSNPEETFSCVERSIRQLIPFEGLYIRFQNPLLGLYEKLSGPQAHEVKAACTYAENGNKHGWNWFTFPFGEDHGFQGLVYIVTVREPSPSALCSVERMLSFCSRSLYQYELLQRVEQYAKKQELLLRELRHRFRNNLQFMLGTLPYLLGDSEVLPTDLKSKLEERLQGLIVLSSIWDSQSVEDAVSAPSYFVSVVRTLRQLWIEGRGSLQLSLQVDESLVLSKGMATTIGLISNELITNTLKHSRNTFPVLEIHIQQVDDRLLYNYQEVSKETATQGETVQEPAAAYLLRNYPGGQGRDIIQGLVGRVGGIILDETVKGEHTAYQFAAAFPLKTEQN